VTRPCVTNCNGSQPRDGVSSPLYRLTPTRPPWGDWFPLLASRPVLLSPLATNPKLDVDVKVNYHPPMSTTTTTFTIGDLAQELAITTRTIRYYEERGLIKPQRTSGGQRIYSRKERGRLKLILRAKDAGFDLKEVQQVLDIYDTQPNEMGERQQAIKLIDMTTRRLDEVESKLSELTELRDQLADHLEYLYQMAGLPNPEKMTSPNP
jgi:DNA-binding transcriptional MerR regulator